MTAIAHFGNWFPPPPPPPCRLPSVGDGLAVGERVRLPVPVLDADAAEADEAEAADDDLAAAIADGGEVSAAPGGILSSAGTPRGLCHCKLTDSRKCALMNLASAQRLTVRDNDKVVRVGRVLSVWQRGRRARVPPASRYQSGTHDRVSN